MRKLLWLLLVVVVGVTFLPPSSANADGDKVVVTIKVVGVKNTPDEPIEVEIAPGIIIRGHVSEDQDQEWLIVRKRTQLEFEPPADFVEIIHKEGKKTIFGFEKLNGATETSAYIIRDRNEVEVEPGMTLTVTWNTPQAPPQSEIFVFMFDHRDEPQLWDYTNGAYFYVEWYGDLYRDGTGWIHPDYLLRWGGRLDKFLVPVWEMTGYEMDGDSRGIPTPTQIEIGEFAPGDVWDRLILPTVGGFMNPSGGQLHFALRDDHGIPIITGFCPSLAVAKLPKPTRIIAWATWRDDHWLWIIDASGRPRQNT